MGNAGPALGPVQYIKLYGTVYISPTLCKPKSLLFKTEALYHYGKKGEIRAHGPPRIEKTPDR